MMTCLKRLKLDVLKPHQPNVLELARAIAGLGAGYRVSVTVQEVDEKTETIVAVVEGEDILFEEIARTIAENGGSLHSIDEVEVVGLSTETER